MREEEGAPEDDEEDVRDDEDASREEEEAECEVASVGRAGKTASGIGASFSSALCRESFCCKAFSGRGKTARELFTT